MPTQQTSYLPDLPGRFSCDRCGRRLTDRDSQRIGRGPVCRRYEATRTAAPALSPAVSVPVAVIPDPPESPVAAQVDDEPFFAWADPDKRVTLARKIPEALAAYRFKRGREPTVILVNAREAARDGVGSTIEGVAVRAGPVAMGVMYVRAE